MTEIRASMGTCFCADPTPNHRAAHLEVPAAQGHLHVVVVESGRAPADEPIRLSRLVDLAERPVYRAATHPRADAGRLATPLSRLDSIHV